MRITICKGAMRIHWFLNSPYRRVLNVPQRLEKNNTQMEGV